MRAAACSYRHQLKAIRLHPDPADMAVAQSVEVELEPHDTPLPTVQTVMEALRTSDGAQSPLLDDFATAAPQTFDATVLVRTSPEQIVFLDEVLGLPERPATLAVYRARSHRLQGLLAHLRQALQAAEAMQATAARAFEKHRQAIRREMRRLRSMRHHIDVLLFTRPRVLRRIRTVLEAYQIVYTHYSEAYGRTAALTAAVAQVEQAVAHYEAQWLARIEQGLEAVINKRAVSLDTVVFAPLEAVYDDLLDATLRSATGVSKGQEARGWAVLRPVLLRAVRQVTRTGLAEMLRTASDPGALLTALEEDRLVYASPLWGGNSGTAEPRHRFVVLPPMAITDLAELRQAAAERHFGPTLLMAETVVAGCCIVALAFFPVRNYADVLTPLYPSGVNGIAQQTPAATVDTL